MALKLDLESEISHIFKTHWRKRDGNVVPEDESVGLDNDAVELHATVLYADLADSTKLVDGMAPFFAAEIYKSYLLCCAKIIRSEGGDITAYDGDRIMAVFIGDSKNTSAVRAALKIHWAVRNIIDPASARQYPDCAYKVRHVVGIDTSNLFIAKTGVRGANDLVWVGRAANYAAKLSALPATYQTYITREVYDVLHASAKISTDGRNMWQAVLWNTFDNRTIYQSNFWWGIG